MSDRVQFDAQSTSPAVRLMPEGRWIMTAGSLQVGVCYSLQLRGLTAGGVRAWSEMSEGKSTESTTTYRERKFTYSGEEMLRRDPVDQAKTLKSEKTRMYGIESVLEQILRCTLLPHNAHSVLR